jgi:hypothetical protein
MNGYRVNGVPMSSTPVNGNQALPLPSGWEVDRDEETGRIFFIDHNK